MKKVLIAYYSASGLTERMARYIGEGIRIGGQEAVIGEISDIKPADVSGYDGYIFGSPTYSLDVPADMKTFLSGVKAAGLKNKLGGAFGSYTHDVGYRHDSHAPGIMADMLYNDLDMKSFELGPLILNDSLVDTVEGMKACQDYGKIFAQTLAGK